MTSTFWNLLTLHLRDYVSSLSFSSMAHPELASNHPLVDTHNPPKRKKSLRDYINDSKCRFMFFSLISTAVCIALAFILAQTLLLSDVNFDLLNDDALVRAISTVVFYLLYGLTEFYKINLSSNLIGIDSTSRTFTVDWFPHTNCPVPELVVDIYFDQSVQEFPVCHFLILSCTIEIS